MCSTFLANSLEPKLVRVHVAPRYFLKHTVEVGDLKIVNSAALGAKQMSVGNIR